MNERDWFDVDLAIRSLRIKEGIVMVDLKQAYDLARQEIAKDKLGIPANSRFFRNVCADYGFAFSFAFTWENGENVPYAIYVFKDSGKVEEGDTFASLFDERFLGIKPELIDITELIKLNNFKEG